MLIITGIFDETRNKLTIYSTLCRNIIFLLTKISFFISSAGKMENVQEFNVKLFEQLFTDDNHIKIVWLHVIVFTEHDLLLAFLRQCPFVKSLTSESALKLLLILSIAQIKQTYKC